MGRHPEKDKKSETVAGKGRKSAKFWASHPSGPPPFGAAQIVKPLKHYLWPKMDWPKLDWPKLVLAKIGRAQNTMAKIGLSKIGQIRMAKNGWAKNGLSPALANANTSAHDAQYAEHTTFG